MLTAVLIRFMAGGRRTCKGLTGELNRVISPRYSQGNEMVQCPRTSKDGDLLSPSLRDERRYWLCRRPGERWNWGWGCWQELWSQKEGSSHCLTCDQTRREQGW